MELTRGQEITHAFHVNLATIHKNISTFSKNTGQTHHS